MHCPALGPYPFEPDNLSSHPSSRKKETERQIDSDRARETETERQRQSQRATARETGPERKSQREREQTRG